jgi:hypothetical protein
MGMEPTGKRRHRLPRWQPEGASERAASESIERHRLEFTASPMGAKTMGIDFVKPCRTKERKPLTFAACAAPFFCSMKITEDVRKYAAEQGLREDEALHKGIGDKAAQFAQTGAELYSKAESIE